MVRFNQDRARAIFLQLRMDGGTLINELQATKSAVFEERKRLMITYPGWNQRNDARIRAFTKLQNVLDRTQFEIIILRRLLDDDWCDQNDVPDLTGDNQQLPDYRTILAGEFAISVKHGFGMSLFILTETYLRIFLRGIDPIACNGATGKFYTVYECLFGSNHLNLPSNERKENKELLDLLRTTRNLIHNDGIYFDRSGQDRLFTYNSKQYRFHHGQPTNFVTWDLLQDLAADLLRLLVQIISHQRVSAISEITDPSAIVDHQRFPIGTPEP